MNFDKETKILYADEGKVLDFKEPKFVLKECHETIQAHSYTKKIRLGRMDSPENYIEIDESEVE